MVLSVEVCRSYKLDVDKLSSLILNFRDWSSSGLCKELKIIKEEKGEIFAIIDEERTLAFTPSSTDRKLSFRQTAGLHKMLTSLSGTISVFTTDEGGYKSMIEWTVTANVFMSFLFENSFKCRLQNELKTHINNMLDGFEANLNNSILSNAADHSS